MTKLDNFTNSLRVLHDADVDLAIELTDLIFSSYLPAFARLRDTLAVKQSAVSTD